MKNKKAIIVIVVIALAAVFVALLLRPKLTSGPSDTVRIAINAPLTGPIAAWSGQFHNGFALGLEDACREQHVDPKHFTVDAQDNAGKPEQAVTILRKQELSAFDVYITAAAGPVNAVAPLVDQAGKPQFLASFDPFITEGSPNRLRVMANSRIEAPLLINYAGSRGAKKIHVIYLNYPNLEAQYSKMLEPELQKLGATVSRERYEMDVRDFRTIVEKARLQAPDLIFVMGFSFHLQPLARDLRAAGLVEKGRIVANMDFVDVVHSDVAKEELKDFIFVAPLFDIKGKVPQAEGWRQKFEARYGVKPSYVPAYAYDNATLIVRAYASSGKVTAATLAQAVPFDGVNGRISLNENRDIEATVALAGLDAAGDIVELK